MDFSSYKCKNQKDSSWDEKFMSIKSTLGGSENYEFSKMAIKFTCIQKTKKKSVGLYVGFTTTYVS